MRPHVRSSSLLDQHGDINYVTFLCSQPIQILLPEAWYQFPGTICMGRLIIRTPTLYWISNLSPKQQTTNTAACTYGRSNISSYYTNVNLIYLQIIWLCYGDIVPQQSIHPRGMIMGIKLYHPILVCLLSYQTTIVYLIIHLHWWIIGAVHNIYPGFNCWGYFILRNIKIDFALAQHSQDKNENQYFCLTQRCQHNRELKYA